MKDWVIALISGLVGSVIGAIVTSWATYHFTNKHRLNLEKEQKKNLMKALSMELSTVWKTYMELIGKDMEKPNIELPSYVMAQTHQNYLIVYDNSTIQIGLLDSEVAEKVIKTYMNVKGFFAEMIFYGKMNQLSSQREKENFFEYLKKRHLEIKEMIKDTVQTLDMPL